MSVNGTVLIGLPVTFLVSRFSMLCSEEPVAETQLGLSRTDHGPTQPHRLTAGVVFNGRHALVGSGLPFERIWRTVIQ